jgi:translation initiation factor IF-2
LKPIERATLSQPIGIVGWSEMPPVGGIFRSFATKSLAEDASKESVSANARTRKNPGEKTSTEKRIPIIIRTDTAGTADAVVTEIEKLALPSIGWKILVAEVGTIGESDIKLAGIDPETIIVGFNTKIDPRARELNEQAHVMIEQFDVIYKLSEFLTELIEKKRPRVEVIKVGGVFKAQKFFSKTKERQVIGGTVQTGEIAVGNDVRILRRENEIGQGTIVGMEQNRVKVKTVGEGFPCGVLFESRIEIAPGDIIEAITKETE